MELSRVLHLLNTQTILLRQGETADLSTGQRRAAKAAQSPSDPPVWASSLKNRGSLALLGPLMVRTGAQTTMVMWLSCDMILRKSSECLAFPRQRSFFLRIQLVILNYSKPIQKSET